MNCVNSNDFSGHILSMDGSNRQVAFEMEGLPFQYKHRGIHLIETNLKRGGGREIRSKGFKFKNGRNERSFIFAPQA